MTTAREHYDSIAELLKQWDPANEVQLGPTERFWGEQQRWLQSRGYILRPRYQPEWVPSWIGTKKPFYECEDGEILPGIIMDATRLSDGTSVAMKKIFKSRHQSEADIATYFSNSTLASDSKNHCVPILDVLEVPGYKDLLLLVMPFLRPCTNPRFLTIGEAVEFFRQVFEGLQFMHKHHVVHRDCFVRNIMMGATALYPDGFHPLHMNRNSNFHSRAKHYTRTERPPKYYLIDFGLSRRYDPRDGVPREYPVLGADKTVPEFQGEGYNKRSNPFPTDIYYLGNMIREEFLDTSFGFDFMIPLVSEMVQNKPSKRPTIDQVVTRFESIILSLSNSQLRSRIVERKELSIIYALLRWWRSSTHFFRRVRFTLQGIPPVPPPDVHNPRRISSPRV